jgi:CBS domain-containing protein
MAETHEGLMMDHWLQALRRCVPFALMSPDHVRQLILSAHERYAPPGAQVLGPEDGTPVALCWLRQGKLTIRSVNEKQTARAMELEAGSFWPVTALMSQRPVHSLYVAREDCFFLCFAWETVQRVMQASPVLSDHLLHEARSILQASQALLKQELQAHHGPDPDELETPLTDLPQRPVLMLPQSTDLRTVLTDMQQRAVGSALLMDDQGRLSGILTRGDVLDRITLPGLALETAAEQVMSEPVHCIGQDRLAGDAALMMAQLGVRHLPVMSGPAVVNMVSERDLFALHRQSLRHVGGLVQQAGTLPEWQAAARAIRQWAAHLMVQGVQPRRMTRLISQLNDQLTCSIVSHALLDHGLEARRMCWVALGSEGRQEQTLATDQDNALVFESATPEADRPRWMAMARQVNDMLDACGYPRCRGGVMACNALWCRTLPEWQTECVAWIDHAGPKDLLSSAVFFDMRPLFGRVDWVQSLRGTLAKRIRERPLFLRQWVLSHLDSGVALNWHGGLATQDTDGPPWIDIKLAGSAIVVDAARILALGQGIEATATDERLQRAGQALGVPEQEYRGWITAFEYLQTLRLRQTLGARCHPNRVMVEDLDLVDRQMLKIAFRAIDQLQQRLRMDYAL